MPQETLVPPEHALHRRPGDSATGGADAAGDAGRVRGPGAPAGSREAAPRCDRARRARLDDLLGSAGQREDYARAPGGQLHRAGLRAVQRGDRGRAAHPGDRDRGARAARVRGRADHPVHGRDPPAQQGAAGQPAAARRGRHHHPDRRHHRESQLRGHRRAALAHPGVRAPAAQSRRTSSCCSSAPWPTPSAAWAGRG